MKKFTSPLTFSISKLLKRSFALIILFSCILSSKTIGQAARLDQWQKLDAAWEFGNLNRRHSNYTEGQSVPYRVFISGLTPDVENNIIIGFDITGANHNPVKHGIDYLTSFNASFPGVLPFDDAGVRADPPGGGFVVPVGGFDIKPIPAPTNLAFLGGVSQGDMFMLGGTIEEIKYLELIGEGDPTKKNKKALIRIKFIPNTQFAVFFFGGHLAEDADYPYVDDGAGGIHGSPYHMMLGSIAGTESRSVQVGLPDTEECDLPIEGSCEPDAKCETTAGGGTAHFDLTLCSSIGSDYTAIAWYDPNDDPIADPTDFEASDGDIVYAVLSNDCGLSEPIYVTLHVNALPTVTCPGNSSVCISDPAFALTGATPTDGGTYSGVGVNGGIFTPTDAGVGTHTITYTYSDGTCSNSCSFTITVNDLPVVTCPANTSVCISVAAYALTGATPTTGTYSGTGVSGGFFNPATAGVGTHTITYSYTDGNTCNNTCSFTITVKPLPTFGTITSTATCSGTSNGTITLASCEANTNYRLKRCSDDYNVQGVRTCLNGTVIWTGLPAGCYYIFATNTITYCTNTSSQTTVVGASCSNTLTQGFYGNYGGKDCNNKTALTLMTAALNGSNKLFGAGARSFTLKTTDLSGGSGAKIFKMLPGGTTPLVLLPTNAPACAGFTATATYDCAASWINVTIQASGSAKGSINNILLAQTMTLFFNLANSANLGTIKIEGNKLTFNNLACGSTTPGSFASIQYIPCAVFNYLNANYAGAGHPNITDLYDLANKVLGNVVTTITASQMNDALNAINVGFDKGKALMKQEITCSIPVTRAGSQIMNEVVAQKQVVNAYPNPFNDQVRFVLLSTESGKATLDIYNMVGQKVKTVFQGPLFANTPQTVEYKVSPLSPSENLIYIFRINGKQFTGKLINIRN